MLKEIHREKQSIERLMPKHPCNYPSGNKVRLVSPLKYFFLTD